MKIKMKMKEINQLKKKNDFINKKINNIFILYNIMAYRLIITNIISNKNYY